MSKFVEDLTVKKVIESLDIQLDKLNSMKERLIDLTIQITETPAPPFREENRSQLIFSMFQELGYKVFRDKVGNVLAAIDLDIQNPVVISAHLDTVFDIMDISVKRKGDKLYGPGVGDDSRGLANLLVIAELLYDTNYSDNLLFVATVGEEGRGDLRGVKHLFLSDEHNYSPKYFLTIDGSGTERIVDQGVGSLRYRVHFTGPGGHSWGSNKTVNPLFALSSFLTGCSKIEPMWSPKTTFSAGLVGGGTSINSIPEHVWVDIDMRSESDDLLKKLDQKVKKLADLSVKAENKVREGSISFKFEMVGNRPPGFLSKSSEIRSYIKSLHDVLNISIYYGASSTDANVPLSLGIPAIAVASVEYAGRAHSLDEWIDASDQSLLPIKRNLILVCLLSQ